MTHWTPAEWARIEQLARSASYHRGRYVHLSALANLKQNRGATLAGRHRAALEGYYAPTLRQLADATLTAGYGRVLTTRTTQ